jgi:hypothetical protein
LNGTEQSVGWAGYVQIDGVAWKWLGEVKAGEPYANTVMGYTTATQSIFTVGVPLTFNMSFLSPIEVRYFWVFLGCCSQFVP